MNVHYTEHGYGYPAPASEPDQSPPDLVARCSGPAGCERCAQEAGWGYGQDGGAGYLKPTEEQLAALHRDDARPCGQRWVAEIQLCPRCGFAASDHRNAP